MTLQELLTKISTGEDSQTQFKSDLTNADSVAAELVAFSNAQGGILYVGVSDNGEAIGVPQFETGRINQLISNAASQHVKSPIAVQTTNVALDNGMIVIIVQVAEGLDKPYFDRNGVVWLKNGADKRRINSKEELQRLLQSTGLVYADEVTTKAGLTMLDTDCFERFMAGFYHQQMPDNPKELIVLLNNMNLAEGEHLRLAGLLLFGKAPQFTKPSFICKAIQFPETDLSAETYLDSEDFEGRLDEQFKGLMAFILRNLHKRPSGQGVNAPGLPEIPLIVFEELIANALVHRDYFVNAPIRLFIFTDRIELVSPGHLPNHLTVPQITAGNSNIRNPVLASFAFKGILPYRGLGTGIRRALADWPHITFLDDREGNQFKVIILRSDDPENSSLPLKYPLIDRRDPEKELIACLKDDPKASYTRLAQALNVSTSTIKRQLQELKQEGKIKRSGAARGGVWELVP